VSQFASLRTEWPEVFQAAARAERAALRDPHFLLLRPARPRARRLLGLQARRRPQSPLGLFVRSLVGLERTAAKEAMSLFVDERTLSANQIEFVNLIVDALTERGVMEPAALYTSPFTDLAPRGPEGIFKPDQVERILQAIASVRASAAA